MKKDRVRFVEYKDGEWFEVNMKGYFLRCCDCGLVHELFFLYKKRDKRLWLASFRVPAKTRTARRTKKFKKKLRKLLGKR